MTIFSSLMLSLASTAVSRLMLSVRSLAAQLSTRAPDWLLSNAELARVNWKPGRHKGELVVEVVSPDADDGDGVEMRAVSGGPAVRTTRVGVLDHPVYPGTRDYRPPRKPRKERAPRAPRVSLSRLGE